MIRFKNIQLGVRPLIAVPFTDKSPTSSNADIAEIRIDQFLSFNSDYVCNHLRQFATIPTIATIRNSEDATSKWKDSEQARLALFRDIFDKVSSIDAVDIELSAKILPEVISEAHKHHKIAIVSFHNFEKTPTLKSLATIVVDAKKLGADIVKIATQVSGDDDVKTLEVLTKTYKSENLIVIGMGKKGQKTRITLPLLGSLVSFACNDDYCSAPGQMNYKQTKQGIEKQKEIAPRLDLTSLV